jgi:hypothetical protein
MDPAKETKYLLIHLEIFSNLHFVWKNRLLFSMFSLLIYLYENYFTKGLLAIPFRALQLI